MLQLQWVRTWYQLHQMFLSRRLGLGTKGSPPSSPQLLLRTYLRLMFLCFSDLCPFLCGFLLPMIKNSFFPLLFSFQGKKVVIFGLPVSIQFFVSTILIFLKMEILIIYMLHFCLFFGGCNEGIL